MNLSLDKQEWKDLLDCINYYRLMPNLEEFISTHSHRVGDRPSLELLWEHFNSCSNEELSELAIECINDICNEDKI